MMTRPQIIEAIIKSPKSLFLYKREIDSRWIFDDHEIITIAVKEHGGNLEYASKQLQNDRDIVQIAKESNPYVLEYASERLRGDHLIVSLAI
jgi:hypothetical protein|tara:strand:+ start:188 stop:463 length:276 start_codon:yes stop_codon:yes gene_type:complete